MSHRACFRSPFWPPDHPIYIPVILSPSSSLHLSSLFFLIPPGLQWVDEQPPQEPEPSCLNLLFPSPHLSHAGLPSAHSSFLHAHVSLQLVPMGHCAIWQADCGTKAEITFVCSFSPGILSLWCYSGSSGKNGSKFIWFAEWFSSIASVSESSTRDLSPISKSDVCSLMSLSRDGYTCGIGHLV